MNLKEKYPSMIRFIAAGAITIAAAFFIIMAGLMVRIIVKLFFLGYNIVKF